MIILNGIKFECLHMPDEGRETEWLRQFWYSFRSIGLGESSMFFVDFFPTFSPLTYHLQECVMVFAEKSSLLQYLTGFDLIFKETQIPTKNRLLHVVWSKCQLETCGQLHIPSLVTVGKTNPPARVSIINYIYIFLQ